MKNFRGDHYKLLYHILTVGLLIKSSQYTNKHSGTKKVKDFWIVQEVVQEQCLVYSERHLKNKKRKVTNSATDPQNPQGSVGLCKTRRNREKNLCTVLTEFDITSIRNSKSSSKELGT